MLAGFGPLFLFMAPLLGIPLERYLGVAFPCMAGIPWKRFCGGGSRRC
jgi:hypothetical protein